MTKRSPTARSYPVRVPRVPVGPLAPMVLGECSGWLAGLGYSPGSAAGVVNVLERLSWWMQLVGSGVDDIDEDLLARFLAVEGSPRSSVRCREALDRHDAQVLDGSWLSECDWGPSGFTHAGAVGGGGLVFFGCVSSAA